MIDRLVIGTWRAPGGAGVAGTPGTVGAFVTGAAEAKAAKVRVA